MKKNIHPQYEDVKHICSCGNTFVAKSTFNKEVKLEICSNCHPIFNGGQFTKVVDIEGRVERFNKKYQKAKQ